MTVYIIHAKAYLAGCSNGDAYYKKSRSKHGSFGLTAKDLDFVQMFIRCIKEAYGLELKLHRNKQGYYWASKANSNGMFSGLESYVPIGAVEMASWLRGVFDSDGSAVFGHHKGGGEGSNYRTISICGSYTNVLERARRYLNELGIQSKLYSMKLTRGHHGTRPMYRIQIIGGKESFVRFLELVGSSIGRKAEKLQAIVSTYCDSEVEHRRGQLLGAAAKNKKRLEVTIPYVLEQIRTRITDGSRLTLRECLPIKGYGNLLKYHNHSELVAMATGGQL